MEKKIIASGKYWICENMDTLAPIIEEGTEYLLSDTSRIRVPYGKEDKRLEGLAYATQEERKLYASEQYGCIFKGDKVIIKRGRKYLNEVKEVKGYYRYDVPNTYGKVYTEYLTFTDGTKCNIMNCDVVGAQHTYTDYRGTRYSHRRYEEKFTGLLISVGGRI